MSLNLQKKFCKHLQLNYATRYFEACKISKNDPPAHVDSCQLPTEHFINQFV